MDVQHVEHRCAGSSTFAPDNIPIVGYDPVIEHFSCLQAKVARAY
jgi:hypothetical protein